MLRFSSPHTFRTSARRAQIGGNFAVSLTQSFNMYYPRCERMKFISLRKYGRFYFFTACRYTCDIDRRAPRGWRTDEERENQRNATWRRAAHVRRIKSNVGCFTTSRDTLWVRAGAKKGRWRSDDGDICHSIANCFTHTLIRRHTSDDFN